MNDSSSSDDETSSYSMIDRIDRLCDEFEEELRDGSQPKIEEYLLKVVEAERKRLLRDLVAVDFEYSRRHRVVDFAEYVKRFPEASDVLLDLQKELERIDEKQTLTPPHLMTGDSTVVAEPEPKPHLKHFRLLEVAGKGGFGTVWRAMDLRLKREVAVKIPRADRAQQVHMSGLMREAQAAAKLKHPNIVSVHEVGEENGLPFIVTDYIQGVNLRDWRKKHAINSSEAARLIATLAMAVQHAHDKGVIHRDLKLGNVLMDEKGEPHVADFGLAKSETRDDSLAIQGQVMGTPAYMAPEQARADHQKIDRRTDVYSIGVMLYELLTGTTPFRGDVPELLQQILEKPPVSPRLINPSIPRDLEAICLKCLAKDNSKRYDTAQALADDLYLFLNGETLRGIPAAMPNRIWKWVHRHRRSVVITSTIAVVVALASAGLMAVWSPAVVPKGPLHQVEFTTDPPGCEITTVAIDPDTGDPDPSQIKHGRGLTPLRMSLAGGNYLVVAVLNSQRFHEVHRRVPKKVTTIPETFHHREWSLKKGKSKVIEMPTITIPRRDITVGMSFSEGTNRLVEPPLNPGEPAGIWNLPAFYVDRSEVMLEDLRSKKHLEGFLQGTGPFCEWDYDRSVKILEEDFGKRLPSATELYYLATVACVDRDSDDRATDVCTLPSKDVIEGLHSGAWEWTSTKPGGPFTGAPKFVADVAEFELKQRMVGGGFITPNISVTSTRQRLLAQMGREVAGFRGVRSEKPRRSKEDFPRRVK